MCALTFNSKTSTHEFAQTRSVKILVLRAIAWACFCSLWSTGIFASAQDREVVDSKVAREFSISKARVIDLELTPTLRGVVEADIVIDGQDLTFEMCPRSLRKSNFVLLEQMDDGSLIERAADAPRTVVGTLRGSKGSRVIGSIFDEGLAAKIVMGDGRVMFIEPVETKVNDPKFKGKHILYRSDDTLPHAGRCGIEGAPLHRFEDIRIANERSNRLGIRSSPPENSGLGNGGGGVQLAELAVDADFEYFSDYGTVQATLDRMELVVNLSLIHI